MRRRSALLLDRDGTLIVDTGYLRSPESVELLPGAAAALRRFAARAALIVVSNQSGLGRGLITADEAEAVHRRFLEAFVAEGVHFDASYYCPHAPEEGCACRKPKPELLLRAAREHELDLERSIMLGDKESDVEAGVAAGCKASLRFSTEGGWAEAESRIASLWQLE